MPLNRLMLRNLHRHHQARVPERMLLLHHHPAIGVLKMVVHEKAAHAIV